MNIGERIKHRRLELGLTQAQLGKRLNISKAAICKAEYSKNDMTTDRIEKFANALECSAEYLMGWSSYVPEYDDTHIELLDLYSKLNDEQKKTVLDLLRSFARAN